MGPPILSRVSAPDLPQASGLSTSQDDILRAFITDSAFRTTGAVFTDLDGTAVHEEAGKIVMPKVVEYGLKHLHDLGRPVILNTLRFPLSVIRTFGAEWYAVSGCPVPLIALNGSLSGLIIRNDEGKIAFQETSAIPLGMDDLAAVLDRIREFLHRSSDVLVFSYPRDWRQGERIWTPHPERIAEIREKYRSASAVCATSFDQFSSDLRLQDVCMLCVLLDEPGDELMAYQHGSPTGFFTHPGVDKLSGARHCAQSLGIDLAASIGAGDTDMDTFLAGVGLGVHVGSNELAFRGVRATVRVHNSLELGELLFRVAQLMTPGPA